MPTSVFERLGDSRLIDHVLLALAIIMPLAVGVFFRVFRHRPIVQRNMHHWVLAILAPVSLFFLWKFHNLVLDRYGVDSVGALMLSALVIIVTMVALSALHLGLYVAFYGREDDPGADDDES